jgi:hypothetical protein
MKIFFLTLILSLFFSISILPAQEHQDLFEYYANRQIDKLETRIEQLGNTAQNDPEVLFFSTVLTYNGDNAFLIYERLFKQSRGHLKNLVAEKLAGYYYARGFYVKSSEFENIAKTYIPVKTTEEIKSGDNIREYKTERSTKSIYKIQVGAFSVIENANELASFLKGKKLEVSVVNRNVSGNNLYCVWVEGGSSFESTENIAKEIKKKYQLSYRIVKP